MNKQHLRSFALSIIALLIACVVRANTKAQSDIQIAATPTWQITQEFCADAESCNPIWRFSEDGQELLFYVASTYQLFKLDMVENVSHYDLSQMPIMTMTAQQPDFVPYDDSSFLYFFRPQRRLYRVNYVTGEYTDFAPGHEFLSCTDVFEPPFRDLMRVPNSDWILTCGLGSSTGKPLNISLLNTTSGEMREIAGMNGSQATMTEWQRVIAGQDGAIYMVPYSGDLLRSLTSTYEEDRETTYFVLKYELTSEAWELIEIKYADLGQDVSWLGRLIGIDSLSYLYFYDITPSTTVPYYTKISPNGELVWHLQANELGAGFPLDITATGELLTLPTPTVRTSSIGMQIQQVDVNLFPNSDAGPDQTLSDTDSSGSEPVTLDGSGSSDPDGTIVSYAWTENEVEIATGVTPTVELAVGVHTITLTVTDDDGLTASDEVVITVEAAPHRDRAFTPRPGGR